MKNETIVRQGFGYKDLDKSYLEDLHFEREISEIKEDQKKKKFLVKEVLNGWELCRNNDRILDFECLRTEFEGIMITSGKNNIIIKIPRNVILRLPSPETYTRCRRNLILSSIRKNDYGEVKELIPTNQHILNKRMKREKLLREFFRRERL